MPSQKLLIAVISPWFLYIILVALFKKITKKSFLKQFATYLLVNVSGMHISILCIIILCIMLGPLSMKCVISTMLVGIT